MNRMRCLSISGSLLVALLVEAVPARAELYRDVAQGLALLDYRFSGQRNLLGDGLTVNANATYSNRRFDFGVADLTLNGAVNASAGFTRRGIPGADFSLNSSGVPLSYSFKTMNGGQNLTATGNVLINVDAHINALGFYEETVEVSNRGSVKSTGLAGDHTSPLAFDVGPINKSGNLYVDLIAKATQPLFDANGVENPFAKFSQQSTKLTNATKTVEELQARAAAGEYLTDAELSSLINNSILTAVLGGKPSGDVLKGLNLTSSEVQSGKASAPGRLVITPEPASLTLLVLALAAGLYRRRWIG